MLSYCMNRSFTLNCWCGGASVAVFLSWARQSIRAAEGDLNIRLYTLLHYLFSKLVTVSRTKSQLDLLLNNGNHLLPL